MSERLSKGPVAFRVLVQMAEDGDDVTNATVIWPETRQLVEFGTVTLTERVDELSPERRKIIFDPVPQGGRDRSIGRPADRGAIGRLPDERPEAAG